MCCRQSTCNCCVEKCQVISIQKPGNREYSNDGLPPIERTVTINFENYQAYVYIYIYIYALPFQRFSCTTTFLI